MIVVADASVVLKWFLRFRSDERDGDLAMDLLDQAAAGRISLVQPPHFIAEVAAVLAREKPADALVDLRNLLELEFQVADTPEIYETAVELARRLGQHVFDTLYHAVALHHAGATLVTADRRYADRAAGEGSLMTLDAWSPRSE